MLAELFSAEFSRRAAVGRILKYAKDASGHEHKGKGPGGGQFTSGGGGGAATAEPGEGKTAATDTAPQRQQPAQKQPAAPAAGQQPGKPAQQPAADVSAPTENDQHTAPPPGPAYRPDPAQGKAARVGVPGDVVPPPPSKIPRLPNLSPDERRVEQSFASQFESNPDGMADEYLKGVYSSDTPKKFETDAAKNMSPDWTQPGQPDDVRKRAQAEYNTALHQTANAITKRAFMKHLDTIARTVPEGQRHCLVTAGGCGAGKGYALKKVGRTQPLQAMTNAIWDSAGDQNSTEMEWIHNECKKRGIKMTAVYVHNDPEKIWNDPEKGVVFRAGQEGRMVDARVFADSHTHGARNFQKWADKVSNDPSAEIVYLDNNRGAEPAEIPGIPPEALQRDPEDLYAKSMASLEASAAPASVKRGGSAGARIWP